MPCFVGELSKKKADSNYCLYDMNAEKCLKININLTAKPNNPDINKQFTHKYTNICIDMQTKLLTRNKIVGGHI